MKIAILGGGAVGRLLSGVIPSSWDVTLFEDPEVSFSQNRLAVSNSLVEGVEWAFPRFRLQGGASDVWGGVVAIPSAEELAARDVTRVSSESLLECFLNSAKLETIYSSGVGPIDYLLKFDPTSFSRGRVDSSILEPIVRINETVRGVKLFTAAERVFEFDYCFVATGASSVVFDEGESFRIGSPDFIGDKLIVIEDLELGGQARFDSDSEWDRLSVPISLPAKASVSIVTTIYKHILSKSNIFPASHVVRALPSMIVPYMQLAMGKVMKNSFPAGFSTYCGKEEYPLLSLNGRVVLNEQFETYFKDKIFMPALHSDARANDSGLNSQRVFDEHLCIGDSPVPYNPVGLRFARLYDKLMKII